MMTTRSSHWPDIQPELLALVLKRLPSLADRVRLRAVCPPWRYNARLEPLPPPLPWLGLLDGTFLSIPVGEIYHMPVLDGVSCHGSMDDWLFVHNDGGCALMNPFSKATLQLPNLVGIWHHEMRYACTGHSLLYKLVVPSSVSLTSDSLVVALVTDSYFGGTICICQSRIATVINNDIKNIVDVAFFDGKLYVLNSDEHLFVLEIGEGHNGNPNISAIRSIVDSIEYPRTVLCLQSDDERRAYVFCNYLVESAGKLLYVRRRIGILVPFTYEHVLFARTHTFAVFEADLTADSCREWRSVNTLRGQALFVGRCSKSLPAAECGVQEDCVYFISDYNKSNPNVDPLRDSGVFNMRNGTITSLLPETVVVQTQGLKPGRRTWFFPTDEAM
ncbi:unnamed protein product [Urochloa decumbens]|uniref:KIB1-4 beta-propeller domain-containing protein n=1 Tax=Urochloa decumbens TaxID=240449 RepID=A0ABC9DWC0_9POAL